MTRATVEITLATAQVAVEVTMTGAPGANGAGVPVGGALGALLRKKSAADFDTEWAATGHGVFSDTTVQSHTAINTPKAVTFNTTEASFGIHIDPAHTSRVVCDVAGLYNFQFSAQVQMTGGGGNLADIWIWPRINGVNVPRSNSHLTIHGNETDVPAWNFMLPMLAGDYFELIWVTASLAITFDSDPAPAFGPSIPSVILTVDKIHQ